MNKKFKVVKIIDDTSLIVNAGSNYGVIRGDIMWILGEGETIIDPETSEILGRIDIRKAKLEVITVYEKMCICKPSYSSNSLEMSTIFMPVRKRLNVEPTDITGDEDKVIRVGDIAQHIKTSKTQIQGINGFNIK